MKAVIMAGGEGSRLRPLTCGLPKPMVPVMNRPVMEYSIELLKTHGIDEIGVTLQYLPECIMTHFDDGKQWDVNLRYYIEETPLGTAGSVKNADEFLDQTFIVISGDALTDIDLQDAIQFHKERGAIATLVTKRVSIPLEYGVIITDKEERITQFLEKPSWSQVFSDTVNTGIYILEPEVLDYFPKGKNFDFSKDLFPILLKEGKPMFGYVTDDYWCDIGDINQYLQAHYDVLDGKVRIRLAAELEGENIWIEKGAFLHEDAHVEGPCYIGTESEIRSRAYIYPYSIIGANCRIYEGASIKRSVLWDQVIAKQNVELRGAVLCSRVHIQKQTSVFEEAVIGENSLVGSSSVVKPGIKVWPEKKIEPASVISRHIIWGTRQTKTLFGECGIAGMVNVDFTPEFASGMGAAYAATLEGNSKVAIASDCANSSLMLKDAVKTGLLSQGVEVFDLGQITTPMTRYGIRFLGLEGGVHVRISENETEQVLLEIMDRNGANIGRNVERKIENLFSRQDYKRASAKVIPQSRQVRDISLFYKRNLINSISTEAIKSYGMRVLVSSKSQMLLQTFISVLDEIGCCVDKVVLAEDETDPIRVLGDTVKLQHEAIGIYVDNNGETMILIDEKGRIIQNEMLTALISLILLKSKIHTELVIPLTAPTVIETMASTHKGRVIRTKSSRQSMMEDLLDCKREDLDTRIEMFNLYFDALAGATRIIEYLSSHGVALFEVINEIPEFHMKSKTVECPWVDKGKVIRNLIESERKNPMELLDGVKVNHDRGWALVLPDADAPLCRVYSEGYSEEYAESLTDMYINKIERIRKS